MMSDTVGVSLDTCARELIATDSDELLEQVICRWFPSLAPAREPAPAPARSTPADARRIGPWRAAARTDRLWFERDDTLDPARMWSQDPLLPPKRLAHRVVLFGESVMRGYGLDPLLNCAIALRSQFCQLGLDSLTDVIDLGRNAMTAPMLIDTMRAAVPLEGDVYVVFAGNNWLVTSLTEPGGESAAREMRAMASWRPMAAHLERAIHAHATHVVSTLCTLSRERGAQLIFIIPPYNLLDWVPDETVMNPLLDSREAAMRLELLARAHGELAAARPLVAEPLLEQIIDLEDGFSPTGWYLLGRCAYARGDFERAWSLLSRARDTLMLLPGPPIPGCHTQTANAIAASVSGGATVIDLPEYLRGCANGAPLGRDWFLDSVHLTAPGLGIVAALLAEETSPLLGGARRRAATGPVCAPAAAAQATAQGCLLGALFCALWGLSGDQIRHYCRAAATAHPDMIEVMRLYIDRAARTAPDVLCGSYAALAHFETTFPLIRYLRRRWLEDVHRPKRFDLELLEAMNDAISDTVPAAPAEMQALIRHERGVRGVVDLLDPSSYDVPFGRVGAISRPNHCYRVSYVPEVVSRLVCDDTTRRTQVAVAARVRTAVGGDAISLAVNGHVVHSWPATQTWSATTCVIGPGLLTPGPNAIALRWPDRRDTRAERADRAARIASRLHVHNGSGHAPGLPAEIYPVFGEVHSFTATRLPMTTPRNE